MWFVSLCSSRLFQLAMHDDVIKWKHFPRYWPFVRGIHRSPVNSSHKDQWRGALMFSLIYAWIIGWVNNGEAGGLRRHRVHYNVIVMVQRQLSNLNGKRNCFIWRWTCGPFHERFSNIMKQWWLFHVTLTRLYLNDHCIIAYKTAVGLSRNVQE